MLTRPLSWFYCCLHPREQSVLRAVSEALFVSFFVGIPVPVYRSFWLLWPGAGTDVRLAFEEVYGLEIVTIAIDDNEVEVVRPRSNRVVFWFGAVLYMATPQSLCAGGCEQSSVP